MSFPKYPRYVNSGVEWMGETPRHWPVMQVRRVARLESGHTPSRSRPDWWQDCTVPWFSLADIWQVREGGAEVIFETKEKVSELGLANSSARVLPKGTVMLSRTASVGFSAIMGVDMATTQDFANWVCGKELLPEYLLMVFRAMTGEFKRLMMGSTHNTIYMPDIQAFRFALPSLDEQRDISLFIKHETSKIDALVEEQKRLIELLKEKRQAVISQAVTKGLDPNVPMKDSGVEWLGEVPTHWLVCALRRVVAAIEQGWSPECEALPADDQSWGVLKAGCVNGGVFVPSENKALPQALKPVPEYEVRPGDVLVSRASGSPELVGSAALVRETRSKLMLSDKIFRVHLTPQMASAFFAWAMNGRALRDQIERALSGGNGLANNLPQFAMLAFLVAVPPIDEQLVIASAVEQSVHKCDALIAQADCAVGLLLERRSALISAAVTGKIDVRNLVPRSEAVPA